MAEQLLLRTGNQFLEMVGIWVSPLSIFGWVAFAILVIVSARLFTICGLDARLLDRQQATLLARS